MEGIGRTELDRAQPERAKAPINTINSAISGASPHSGAVRDVVAYADAIYANGRLSRLHPDVVLRAFGLPYPSHRVILASQSAYFATLLRWSRWQPAVVAEGDVGEDLAGIPCLELVLGEEVTQKGFEWILEYFYASPHCTVSSDNAFDVLSAAHYLGINAVQTACVEFLSQHLDPTNFTSCLHWATRADHGEASEMLAAACRRLLALRLPSNLPAWAPALAHMEPRTLLDILSSDCLAVQTEYDRYQLVKQVAKLLQAAAAAAAAASGMPAGGRSSGSGGGVPLPHGPGVERHESGAAAAAQAAEGSVELQRMLSSALHIADEGVARRLHLARSCPAAIPAAAAPPAAAGYGIWCGAPYSGGGGGGGDASLLLGSGSDSVPPSDCGAGGEPSSRLSSQTTERSVASASFAAAGAAGVGSGLGVGLLVEATGALASAAAAAGRGSDAGEGAGRGGDACLIDSAVASSWGMGGGSGGGAAQAAGLTAPAGGAAAAAACARLLLEGAVRYEHLTVPQLMEAQREGLVSPQVLHAALWSRTQLDFAIFCSSSSSSSGGSSANGGGAGSGAGGGGEGAGGGRGAAAAATAAAPAARPFRLCWRLPCGALKKLQAPDLLQSEAQPYAGAMWQVRMSYGGGGSAAARSHLGLYVGRHFLPAAAPGGARSHGSDPSQQQQQQQQRRPQPPRHQQHPPAAAAAAAPAPAAFASFTDRQSALRSRCRVWAYQPDNTVLGGRLRLGEAGPFTADFTAGAFFGQAKLLPTADLALLEDESELLVFVELLALAGGADGL